MEQSLTITIISSKETKNDMNQTVKDLLMEFREKRKEYDSEVKKYEFKIMMLNIAVLPLFIILSVGIFFMINAMINQ